MADFVSLTCPSCGGKLEVTPDLERFACAYCGAEHVVKRGGGIISLQPVAEAIGKVQAGVDRTASELAIKRLKDEIDTLQAQKNIIADSNNLLFGCTGLAGLFAIGSILTACVMGLDNGGWIAPAILWVIFLLTYQAYSNKKKELAIKIKPIDEQINQRLAEIQRYRQIVANPSSGR